jgi:signal transduction histidine kinase
VNSLINLVRRGLSLIDKLDGEIPDSLTANPESFRRARLIMRFGLMGSIFGTVYALFYLLVGHNWGAEIIACCTVGVALTPLLMIWKKSTELAGHFFAMTLTAGFSSLCCCEGGVHGHALAWLVSVPLCALLLLGQREAVLWLALAFLSASLVVGCDLAGIRLPTTFDPRYESVISAAGYLGLVLFMSMLGLIFERGRAKAHASLEAALSKLSITNGELVGLNKEKSEFLSMAAHDLKNPLQAIMASAEMMTLIDDPATTSQMIELITSASKRMHHLITDLLDANQIEEGRYASKLEACDVGALVAQIVGQNLFSAQQKKIEIRVGLQDNLIARTDAAASLQILDNLISNAIKYSPQNTTVHVLMVPEKDHALVMVRDEGPGISEDDQKKLFKKYSRLTARPTGGESSTGLGLSIAKRLAQVLGGDILCRSALGAGTTFTFRLPLDLQPAENVHVAKDEGVVGLLREPATLVSYRN